MSYIRIPTLEFIRTELKIKRKSNTLVHIKNREEIISFYYIVTEAFGYTTFPTEFKNVPPSKVKTLAKPPIELIRYFSPELLSVKLVERWKGKLITREDPFVPGVFGKKIWITNPFVIFPIRISPSFFDIEVLHKQLSIHYSDLFKNKWWFKSFKFLEDFTHPPYSPEIIVNEYIIPYELTQKQVDFMSDLVRAIENHFKDKTVPIEITFHTINPNNDKQKIFYKENYMDKIKELETTIRNPQYGDDYTGYLFDVNGDYYLSFTAIPYVPKTTSPIKPRRKGGWIDLYLDKEYFNSSFYSFCKTRLGIGHIDNCCFVRALTQSEGASKLLQPNNLEFLYSSHTQKELLNIKIIEIKQLVADGLIPSVSISTLSNDSKNNFKKVENFGSPPYIKVCYTEKHYFPHITDTGFDMFGGSSIYQKQSPINRRSNNNQHTRSSSFIMRKLIEMREDDNNKTVTRIPHRHLLIKIDNGIDVIKEEVEKLYTTSNSLLPKTKQLVRAGFRRDISENSSVVDYDYTYVFDTQISFDPVTGVSFCVSKKLKEYSDTLIFKEGRMQDIPKPIFRSEEEILKKRKGKKLLFIGYDITKQISFYTTSALSTFGKPKLHIGKFTIATFIYSGGTKITFIDLQRKYGSSSIASPIDLLKKIQFPVDSQSLLKKNQFPVENSVPVNSRILPSGESELDAMVILMRKYNAYYKKVYNFSNAIYKPSLPSLGTSIASSSEFSSFKNVYTEEMHIYKRFGSKFLIAGRVISNDYIRPSRITKKIQMFDMVSIYAAAIVLMLRGLPEGKPTSFYSSDELRKELLSFSTGRFYMIRVTAKVTVINPVGSNPTFPVLYNNDENPRVWTNNLIQGEIYYFTHFEFVFYIFSILTRNNELSAALIHEYSAVSAGSRNEVGLCLLHRLEDILFKYSEEYFNIEEGLIWTSGETNTGICKYMQTVFNQRSNEEDNVSKFLSKAQITSTIGAMAVRVDENVKVLIPNDKLDKKIRAADADVIEWSNFVGNDKFVVATLRNRFPRNTKVRSLMLSFIYSAARVMMNQAVYYNPEPLPIEYSDTDSLAFDESKIIPGSYFDSLIDRKGEVVGTLGMFHSDLGKSFSVYGVDYRFLTKKGYAILKNNGEVKYRLSGVEDTLIIAEAKRLGMSVFEFYTDVLDARGEYEFDADILVKSRRALNGAYLRSAEGLKIHWRK